MNPFISTHCSAFYCQAANCDHQIAKTQLAINSAICVQAEEVLEAQRRALIAQVLDDLKQLWPIAPPLLRIVVRAQARQAVAGGAR